MSTDRDTTQAITPSSFEPLNQGQQPETKGGWGWRRWLLPIAILLFALVMAFLFTARSVEISVTTWTASTCRWGAAT